MDWGSWVFPSWWLGILCEGSVCRHQHFRLQTLGAGLKRLMLKRSNCDPCYWRLLPKVIHKRLLIENLMISMTLFLFIIRHPLLASLVARGQDNMFLLLDCILHKRKIVYTEFFTKRYSFLSVIPTETWPQHNLHTGSRPLSLIWQFVKHFHVRPFEKVKVNVLLGLWSGIKNTQRPRIPASPASFYYSPPMCECIKPQNHI